MSSDENGRPYSAGQLRIVLALSTGTAYSLQEIADRTKLSVGYVHNIITNLRTKNIVRRIPSRYELTPNWKSLVKHQELSSEKDDVGGTDRTDDGASNGGQSGNDGQR